MTYFKHTFRLRNFVLLCLPFLFSFENSREACEYAGSNLQFAKEQTELALSEKSINMAKYYAFKALNAIEKTKDQLDACGCMDAEAYFMESLDKLKEATRTKLLTDAKAHINRALALTEEGMWALKNFNESESIYNDKVLSMATSDAAIAKSARKSPEEDILHMEIDQSLKAYEKSLDEIVRTVDCKDALSFAKRIYDHSEKELLKTDLTDGKRYYNLRVKELTQKAITQLSHCQK